MSEAILVLNAGSSNLKFAAFSLHAGGPERAFHGQIDNGDGSASIVATAASGRVLTGGQLPAMSSGQDKRLGALLAFVEQQLDGARLVAVGHRIVHGGLSFRDPVLIDQDVLTKLDALCPLAPLHQPHNLEAARVIMAIRPQLPQVACFDTAFHQGHEAVVTRFALPREWHDRGVRRYGFHGLSYEYVHRELGKRDPVLAAGRVIIAHLGAGASLCAVRNGVSIDTTMGFTALDGLMMSSRCGALDPGVVIYLQQQEGMTPKAVETLLYNQSGLLGVSGLSGDMRVLLESGAPEAKEAVDLFCFRIAREAGALMASMGGLDGIVFTGGIGENAPQVRADVAGRLAWAGLALDDAANAKGTGRINRPASKLQAWVIPTNEEAVIAQQAARVITTSRSIP